MYASNSMGWTLMMIACCYTNVSLVTVAYSLGVDSMVHILEDT